MRLAFYGRVSTEDAQDPAASRAWQMRRATDLIAPHGGVIVEEFFDIGTSRSLPWLRRPEGNRLLEALKDKDRGFDGVVIGEPQRAFYGAQFQLTFPLLTHYGVSLWVPEVGGRVDPGSEAHDLVMSLFGGMSKGERSRVQLRTKTAMSELARTTKRHLGGRPPYGYLLADAGAHPNPAKASLGQRAHVLAPDPLTAPVAVRIFEMYGLEGLGLRTIAQRLTDDGIPSPSQYDRARNSHRDPRGWAHGAVRSILTNPTYTGFRAWGKQEKFERLMDPSDVAAGNVTRMRHRPQISWIVPEEATHEAIISLKLFASVQARINTGRRFETTVKARETTSPYALRGLLVCSACGRKMQGSYRKNKDGSGRVLYRCNVRSIRAMPADLEAAHPTTTSYVREDAITARLDAWVASFANPQWLASSQAPDPHASARSAGLRAKLTQLDSKVANLMAALENCDAAAIRLIASQLSARQSERDMLMTELQAESNPDLMTKEDVTELLDQLGGIPAALALATAEEKASIYDALGVRIEFDPIAKRVVARAEPTRLLALPGQHVLGRVRRGT